MNEKYVMYYTQGQPCELPLFNFVFFVTFHHIYTIGTAFHYSGKKLRVTVLILLPQIAHDKNYNVELELLFE